MFTDPVAQVVIVNPSSGKEWDWTAPDFPFLTGLSFMWEEQGFGVISVTIDVPYDDGIAKIMTPPTPFAVGNHIRARIGYAGGKFTDWAIGILEAGGEGLSVDANGVSGSVNFAGVARSANYTMSKEIKTTSSYDKLLEVIAEYMGLQLEITPEALEALKELDKVPIEPSAFMDMSAVELLSTVCEMGGLHWIAGPAILVHDNTRWLTISKPREINLLIPPAEINTYVMRGLIDVDKKQYPLLSTSVPYYLFLYSFQIHLKCQKQLLVLKQTSHDQKP